MFNIFLCDIFHDDQQSYFANYADDTTPSVINDNATEVLTGLSGLAQKLFTWFPKNKMKANHDRYYLFLRTQESSSVQKESFTIKYSKAKKLL